MPINSPKKRILMRRGFESFENCHYNQALDTFSQALVLDAEDLESKIGAILADMALDFPLEAHGFYELYQMMLRSSPRTQKKYIQQNILEAIESFDKGLERVSAMIGDQKQLAAEKVKGILYRDFKEMCRVNGFKQSFESLIFSTKIIFTQKEDFYDFLEALVDHDFGEYCLQYIENMRQSVGYDSRINAILQKMIQKDKKERK